MATPDRRPRNLNRLMLSSPRKYHPYSKVNQTKVKRRKKLSITYNTFSLIFIWDCTRSFLFRNVRRGQMKTNDFLQSLQLCVHLLCCLSCIHIKIDIVHQFCIIINCANTYEYCLTEAIIATVNNKLNKFHMV